MKMFLISLICLFHCATLAYSQENKQVVKEIKWQEISPLEYLDLLKESAKSNMPFYTIWNRAPKDWIKKEHLNKLVELIDSNESASHTLSALSSYLPAKASTVGDEAMYLLKGYREGIFPPSLCSGKGNPEEFRSWWSSLNKPSNVQP